MINYNDYFGGLTEEEYVKETEEHFKCLEKEFCTDVDIRTEVFDDDIIVLYFDAEKIKPDKVYEIYNKTKEVFVYRAVLAVPNNMSLKFLNKEQLLIFRDKIDEVLNSLVQVQLN